LLLVGLSLLVYRQRQHRFLTVGWLWFLGTMVPMIGVIQVGTQAMADRYTYLPYLGLYVMVVWGIGKLVRTGPVAKSASKPPVERSVAIGLAVMVLAALAVVTFGQIGVWRNSLTLGYHAIAKGAAGPKVNYNLATALSQSGQFATAVPFYEVAIRLKPDHAKAYNNLGRTLARLKKGDKALASFDRAIALEPDFAGAYENKSNTLAEMQRLDESIAARHKALELDPDNVNSRLALGGMLAALGRLEEAIAEFESVLSRAPNHQEAAQNLALARRLQAQRAEETSP
jgi:predicted Zn-dependent protease